MQDNAVFAGDLCFISLADCFQILGSNNSTGILKISSPYTAFLGTIHFVDGNPVNGHNGSLQGIDAIYSLFGWLDGSFEFFEDEVQVERAVHSGRMEIVLDALRMLDDGLVEKIGPETCRVVSVSQADPAGTGLRERLPLMKGPLVDYMHIIDEEGFRDGVTIVSEGGHGSWIWVILEGTVRVARQTEKGSMNIARLGEGCFIGALTSFLRRDYARNASVIAEGPVQLGVLDTQRLHREFALLSAEFRELIPGLDIRLNKVTDRAVEIFQGTNRIEESLPEGEKLIVKEGGFDKDLYFITSGTARVIKKNPKGYLPLLDLGEGDFFGDIQFLKMGHEPQHASVAGPDELVFKKVNSRSLQKEYQKLSGTLRNLIDNTCLCISITTRLISA
jgi:CRP-like cAMP-binding protein